MTTLLETKLQPPSPRPGAVERVRLLDRLGRDAVPRLVLVSAPPGFGKSTLVAQWLAALGEAVAVAWVALDAGDSDPARFWRYVATAVERAAPGAGAAALAALDGADARPDDVLASLVNGLAALDRELLLCLDDLHVIERREITDGLALLLDRLPPRAHLVVLTRADPSLPVARLRARGELVELRAADLRFTPDEAAAYLNGSMGLSLAAGDVDALESRTEGWVAALQLAAISMQGRDDAAAFVAQFAGDDRHVVDYLADEVLARQSGEVREFLLATSILERLTGPLCDAVTGGEGGAAMLEALERANLFLVPLDDRRRWYRYHHLFADLLRARLLERPRDAVAALHGRASAWWEANGEPRQAVEHALAAGDVARAADLVELEAHELRRTRQEATLRRWLDALPDEAFETRPVLAIAHAGALLSTGEARGVEARLAAAERWVEASSGEAARSAADADGMVVRHATALGHLRSAIALYRAAIARMRGDVDETIRQARAALEASGPDQPLERGAAAGILALAQWTGGDLETAHASWAQALEGLERAGHRSDMLGGFLAMADIRVAQGRLGNARRTLERGLRVGTADGPPLRGTADMHVGLAEVALETGDVAAARGHLADAEALGESLGLPQHPFRRRVAAAAIREAEGDVAGALALLDAADRVYVSDFFPDARPIPSLRARTWARHGQAADAIAWAAETGLTDADAPSYVREHAHVTLALALLADGSRARADAAARLVDRLHDAAVAGGRTRAAVELLALRAAARAATGDREGAAVAIDRALALAAPEDLVRALADLGVVVAPLVRDAARRAAPSSSVARVAAAVEAARSVAPSPAAPPAAGSAPSSDPARTTLTAAARPLVEPLSERELDVLRLLASDLDGPEIASQLFVSLNTMRTHTKHIFAKLGVTSRRAAVTRAIELGLLPRR